MSRFVSVENSLYNGISQQNPELRLPSQVEDAVNTKLSVANGVEKRPSAALITKDDQTFNTRALGVGVEVDSLNKFIVMFNTSGGVKKAYATDGSVKMVVTQDNDVDTYLTSERPREDLRFATVLSTTFITNKNITVGLEDGDGTSIAEDKYLWFKNGVQQVTREVTIDANVWSSAKSPDNDTEVLVDDFVAWAGALNGFQAVKISDSVAKVRRNNNDAFTMEATDSYSDTTMTITPEKGADIENLPPKAEDGEIVRIIYDDASEADYYLKFDATTSSWYETVAPGTKKTIDPHTMPHKMEFIEDTDGSVTGTVGEYYFYISRIDWAERTTGEEGDTDPSFIGSSINDIFFYKNRLGFVSKDSVVCSAVDDLYNYWPKTVKEVLDSDPIDRSMSTTKNVTLEFAEVFPDSMAIIGDNTQYSLHSDGKPFTNQNATMDVTTSYQVSTVAKPEAVGSSLYLTVPRDSYSAIREYAIIPDTLVTDAADVTGHIPRYLPSGIQFATSDASLGEVFFFAPNDNNGYFIYNYTYYWQGNEKVQSAWSKWTVWFRTLGAAIFDGTLYIVGRESGTGTDGSPSTILTAISLETESVLIPGFSNTEPLIDRLELYPDSDVIDSGNSTATVLVTEDFYNSVESLGADEITLVDRVSGASGSLDSKYEQDGKYYLVFNLKIISKFNFNLFNNNNLVGQHKIGGTT